MFGWILFALVVFLLAYVRLAPSDPAQWHRATGQTEAVERQGKGSYTWRGPVPDTADAMRQLDAAAMASPRTSRLAGSVEEGQVTYVTRSQVIGFPDYTTITALPDGQGIEIYARLRFGRSDFGVNTQRAKAWRAVLG